MKYYYKIFQLTIFFLIFLSKPTLFFGLDLSEQISESTAQKGQPALKEKPIVVVIPSYNNARWVSFNLNSILTQNYKNFRIIYIDDASIDETSQLVLDCLDQFQLNYHFVDYSLPPCYGIQEALTNTEQFQALLKSDEFFIFVKNQNRCGAMENLYRAFLTIDDDAIIVTVDGDDALAHPNVLSELNECYSTAEVWYTHGTMQEYPNGSVSRSRSLDRNVILNGTFRKSYCPSHLRTFYSWLFKKIDLKDLFYKNQFFPMTWDKAMMFPIAEMARERHAFISKFSYIYNVANPINDDKVNYQLQIKLDQYIHSKKPYPRLDERTF